MKKLFFILIFSLFILGNKAFAACPDNLPSPKIELYTSYGKINYIQNLDNRQITELAAQKGYIEKGIFASGLSFVEVNMDITLKTIGDIIDKYDICVYPTSIRLSVYFSNPTIYISNQLSPNSCEYKVVLRHEQTHQQINKSALDYFLPLFKSATLKIAPTIKPINVTNISEIDGASNILTEKYNQKLTPLLNFFKQQLQKEQFKLDNQLNYQYENTLCR